MWGGHSMERAVSPEGLVLVSQRSMQQIFVMCFSSLHSYRKQGTAITLGRVQAVWGGLGWVSWLTGLSVVEAAFCN